MFGVHGFLGPALVFAQFEVVGRGVDVAEGAECTVNGRDMVAGEDIDTGVGKEGNDPAPAGEECLLHGRQAALSVHCVQRFQTIFALGNDHVGLMPAGQQSPDQCVVG